MVDYTKFREFKYLPLAPTDEYKREYFIDEHQRIGRVLDTIGSGYLAETNVDPEYPRNGDIRYADGSNWNPASGRGIYYYDGDIPAWVTASGPRKTESKTADYTITSADDVILVDATSGNVTVTLPTAVGLDGRRYHIKKTTGPNSVIIDGNGAETIDGSLTAVVTIQYVAITVVSDNANWHII